MRCKISILTCWPSCTLQLPVLLKGVKKTIICIEDFQHWYQWYTLSLIELNKASSLHTYKLCWFIFSRDQILCALNFRKMRAFSDQNQNCKCAIQQCCDESMMETASNPPRGHMRPDTRESPILQFNNDFFYWLICVVDSLFPNSTMLSKKCGQPGGRFLVVLFSWDQNDLGWSRRPCSRSIYADFQQKNGCLHHHRWMNLFFDYIYILFLYVIHYLKLHSSTYQLTKNLKMYFIILQTHQNVM